MMSRYSLIAAAAVAVAVLAMTLLVPPRPAQGGEDTPPQNVAAVSLPGMADIFPDEKRNAQEQELPSQF